MSRHIPEPPWEILARYGRGEAKPEEIEALHDWAADDRSHHAILGGVQRLAEVSQHLPGGSRVDVVWARVRAEAEKGPVRPHEGVLRLEPTSVPARIRTATARPWLRFAAAAAAAAIVVASTLRLGSSSLRTGAQSELREVASPAGGRLAMRLADGTHVTLGPESRMRYAVGGAARVRTVYLTGAAMFNVAHDSARPFVVHAMGGEAQAIGTSFDVRSYPDDSMIVVTVAEGRVALRPARGAMGSGTMLTPGQRGILQRGLVRVESDVDWRRELAWTTGQLVYDLAPLGRIAADVRRWFGVQVVLPDSSWASARITVTLEPDSIDLSLRRLAEVLEVPYRRVGTQVYFGSTSSVPR